MAWSCVCAMASPRAHSQGTLTVLDHHQVAPEVGEHQSPALPQPLAFPGGQPQVPLFGLVGSGQPTLPGQGQGQESGGLVDHGPGLHGGGEQEVMVELVEAVERVGQVEGVEQMEGVEPMEGVDQVEEVDLVEVVEVVEQVDLGELQHPLPLPVVYHHHHPPTAATQETAWASTVSAKFQVIITVPLVLAVDQTMSCVRKVTHQT